jgi:stress response protein SCP2
MIKEKRKRKRKRKIIFLNKKHKKKGAVHLGGS